MMKFFLCILVIASVCADTADRRWPSKSFDFTKCCNLNKSPASTQFNDYWMTLVEQCKQEIGEPTSGKPPRIACFHECIANKTNIINVDKSLNQDVYRSFVTTKMATEDYQKSVADGIVTKCIAHATSPDSSNEPSPDGCNKTAMRAMHCTAKDFINSCPTDQQSADEKCVKFREFINNGFKPMGNPPSHGNASN